MSLESAKAKAVQDFTSLMTEMRTKTELSDQEFAEQFFDLMLVWLQQAGIKYISGLTTPNGPVTGTFTGTLE